MNRNIKKSFWMSREEKDNLERKAQASCLTESEFIRQRIIGYEPPQAIDDRFWQAMDIIREFADKIDSIAINADNPDNVMTVMNDAKKWRIFQNAIEKEFLRPKRSID